jgi:hypothetical protein
LGFFYLVIGIPFWILAYIRLIQKRTWTYIKMHVKHFKKDTDVETYIITLIDLIENREEPEKKIILEGIVKYHLLKSCNKY